MAALVTPPNDCSVLPGHVARRRARTRRRAGCPRQIRDVFGRRTARRDEVWIASAGRGVLPVTSVDGRRDRYRPPGPGVAGDVRAPAAAPRRDCRPARHGGNVTNGDGPTPAPPAASEDTLFEFPCDFPGQDHGPGDRRFSQPGARHRHAAFRRTRRRPDRGAAERQRQVPVDHLHGVSRRARRSSTRSTCELTSCSQVLVAL